MKKRLTTVVATVALIAAATAGAAIQRTIYSGHGISCHIHDDTAICIRNSGTGYGVAFNRDAVLVMRFYADGRSHRVFARMQP